MKALLLILKWSLITIAIVFLILLAVAIIWHYYPRPTLDYSTHHGKNGRFHNPRPLEKHDDIFAFIKWRLTRDKVKPVAFDIKEVDFAFLQNNKTRPTLTFIGHSTFLIQYQGMNILTDPVFSKRVSPVQWIGPKRTTATPIKLAQLPPIDVVIISHDHYDHLDLPTVKWFAKQENPPLFIVPLGIGDWLAAQGYSNWRQLDWWQNTSYKNWRFNAVPVQHFSGRHLLKMSTTLWAGWVIEPNYEAQPSAQLLSKIFFAGDTGYFGGFKKIEQRFGAMDLSLIPIGAYNPRWFMQDMHVAPREAVKIHRDVKSKYSVGMHFGTFILTDEPMREPPQLLKRELARQGVDGAEFVVYKHGQMQFLDEVKPLIAGKKPSLDSAAKPNDLPLLK